MSQVLRSLCSRHRALVPGGPSPRCVLWRLGFTLEVPLLAIPPTTQNVKDWREAEEAQRIHYLME